MKIIKSPIPKAPNPVSEWSAIFHAYPSHVPGFKTAKEIADETGTSRETVRKRLAEMEKLGQVETCIIRNSNRAKSTAYRLKHENKKPQRN